MDPFDIAALVFGFGWCGFLCWMGMRLKRLGQRFTPRLFVSGLQGLFINAFFWLFHHREVTQHYPFLHPALWIAAAACAVGTAGPGLVRAFTFSNRE